MALRRHGDKGICLIYPECEHWVREPRHPTLHVDSAGRWSSPHTLFVDADTPHSQPAARMDGP